MKRRTVLLALAGAAGSAGSLAACRSHRQATGGFDKTPIVVAAGSTVGVYYQYGNAIADLCGDVLGPMRIVSTTGSVDNLKRLSTGEAMLAFTAADAATDVLLDDSLGQPVPIRAIAKLYDDYIHLVVPVESPIMSIADLRGRRVSVGAAGSGTALIADRLLGAANLDPHTGIGRSQLSLDDSAAALDNSEIDAFFWSGGLPTVAVTALARSRRVRLVDLHDAAAVLRVRFGTCYRVGVIPPGTYTDQAKPVPTLAVPNLLVALSSQPDAGVRTTCEFIFDNAGKLGAQVPVAAELDRHTALFTEPIPLHNGALAYYRSDEVG